MSTSSFLSRRLAAGLVAAPLVFGMVSAPAFAAPAPSVIFLKTHGDGGWQGYYVKNGPEFEFGAITEMNKGGFARIVVKGGAISLILTDPSWDLKANLRVPISVEIDGKTLTGTAVVMGRDIIEVPGAEMLVKDFGAGAQAIININDGDIVWTLDLHGFTAAIWDASKVYRV